MRVFGEYRNPDLNQRPTKIAAALVRKARTRGRIRALGAVVVSLGEA